MTKLVLLRHGESIWNQQNRFTGWTNVQLSKKGIFEAKNAGQLLLKASFSVDKVFTSLLERANHTMDICLSQMNVTDVKKIYHWRLNERHYGSLQGLNKKKTELQFGKDQVLAWRRSYDIPPPPLMNNDPRHPMLDPLYSEINQALLPSSESLKDTINRILPIWEGQILPSLKSGEKIIIVAHGNSLRAIVKILDKISHLDIVKLNIPTGCPLVYKLDEELKVLSSYYLEDPTKIK